MGDTKAKKNGKTGKIIKKIIDITLAITIAGAAVYGIKTVTNDFSDIDFKKNKEEQQVVTSTTNQPQANSIIYVTQMTENENIYSGPLIVVNSQSEFKGNDDDLVSMYDIRQTDGTEDYLVMSADVKLRTEAATALNNMVKAFATETGKKDIIIDGGYRSVEYQQELYDAAEDKSMAAVPGTSDYHTGYSIDLGISSDDGTMSDFSASGDYAWFEKNSYKYGFVLRFPNGKQDITGYDYRPWHFRYVGAAHAYYMYKNNLTIEEYTQKLKTFDYTQTHLIFNDDNGNEYEVYYYPADMTSSTTIVAVPDSEYQISGNNADGFIISSLLSSKPAVTETNTQAAEAVTEKSSETKQTEAADNTENASQENTEE